MPRCSSSSPGAWQPDVVIRDEVDFGAAIAAERLAIPCASVLVLASGGFLRKDVVAEPLHALRAEYGLPDGPGPRMLDGGLVLSPFPPSFRSPDVPLPARAFSFRPGAATGPHGLGIGRRCTSRSVRCSTRLSCTRGCSMVCRGCPSTSSHRRRAPRPRGARRAYRAHPDRAVHPAGRGAASLRSRHLAWRIGQRHGSPRARPAVGAAAARRRSAVQRAAVRRPRRGARTRAGVT